MLLIRGEAGIGKSRLADSLVADALSAGKAVLTAFCAPDRQASRLYPIAGMLERAFDLPTGDDDTTLAKLEEASAALGLTARDTVPFLADVIGLGAAHFADALALEPHVLRERTFSAITAVVEADARARTDAPARRGPAMGRPDHARAHRAARVARPRAPAPDPDDRAAQLRRRPAAGRP